jgi:integrase
MDIKDSPIKDNRNDPLFITFVTDRDLSSSTIRIYAMHLQKFCNVVGKYPTQLIEEAEDEEDEEIRSRKRKIKKYIEMYHTWLIEGDYAPSRIRVAITVVRSFYNHNDILIPTIQKTKIRDEEVNHEIYSIPNIDDIRHAMKYIKSWKWKAAVLLMMSSGMGLSEIISLKIKNFLEAIKIYIEDISIDNVDQIESICNKILKEKDIVGEWRVIRSKTKYPYITFNTTESNHAICEYLLEYPPKSIDEPLFRNPYSNNVPAKTCHQFFYRVNARAGFKNIGRQTFFRSHNLRKFFVSTLLKN